MVDNAGHPTKVMQWDSGDLSLIKGIMVQGEAARGQSNQGFRRVLKQMLNNANGVSVGMAQGLPDKVVDRESVADTGASVVCGGKRLMQEMGLTLVQLLPSNLTLFTADKQSLSVLGAVIVIIFMED